MATATGVSLAIGILVDAGMLPGIVDAEGGKRRIRAWMTLLDQDMTDEVLAEAVRRVASGDVETYGAAKPQHVNRAAKAVRGERIRAWRRRAALASSSRRTCGGSCGRSETVRPTWMRTGMGALRWRRRFRWLSWSRRRRCRRCWPGWITPWVWGACRGPTRFRQPDRWRS